MPFRGGCYPGVAGIVKAERQAVTYLYSGIAAASPITIDGQVSTGFASAKTGQAFTSAQPKKTFSGGRPTVTFT